VVLAAAVVVEAAVEGDLEIEAEVGRSTSDESSAPDYFRTGWRAQIGNI